jgi:UDP-glucuronate decarboxylase
LGNPGEFTIGELANIVIEKTNSDSKIDYLPLPVDDPIRRQPDITRAKETLGWEPTIALSEGLDTTIAHFRENVLS